MLFRSTPTFAMSLHAAPALGPTAPQWKIHTASERVPLGNPLTTCKSANKLLQVLARAEAEAAGADDALLLNVRGELVETSCANLFWIEEGTLHTPPLAAGALAGITRAWVLDWAEAAKCPAAETLAAPERLLRSGGCFLTLSSLGVVEVMQLDGQALPSSLLTNVIRERLLNAWQREAKRLE